MTYIHGQTVNKPRQVQQTADEVRAHVEHLRQVRAQVIAETAAKEKELARIRASRKRNSPQATYKPTPTALAWRELYGHTLAKLPEPIHGGHAGLIAATRESVALSTCRGL